MYTLRHIPVDRRTVARGLSLDEAFIRMLALAGRQYAFVRTGWAMQLLMTNAAPGEPEFLSHATNNAVARQDIKGQVCRHGLGLFEFTTDAEYASRIGSDRMAAE